MGGFQSLVEAKWKAEISWDQQQSMAGRCFRLLHCELPAKYSVRMDFRSIGPTNGIGNWRQCQSRRCAVASNVFKAVECTGTEKYDQVNSPSIFVVWQLFGSSKLTLLISDRDGFRMKISVDRTRSIRWKAMQWMLGRRLWLNPSLKSALAHQSFSLEAKRPTNTIIQLFTALSKVDGAKQNVWLIFTVSNRRCKFK